MEKFLDNLLNNIQQNIIGWVINAVITFLSVKLATRKYYYTSRAEVSKEIMKLGICSMLNLKIDSALPSSASVIFVEYGKRSIFLSKRNMQDLRKVGYGKRHLYADLRKTVTVFNRNNSTQGISKYRPQDYGVLGAANKMNAVLLFDFKEGKLYKFTNLGEINEQDVKIKRENGVKKYLVIINGKEHLLSTSGVERSVMIAAPIGGYNDEPLLGGVTFDMDPGSTTLYQKIDSRDSTEAAKEKKEINKKVYEAALITAECLKMTYFNIRGRKDDV